MPFYSYDDNGFFTEETTGQKNPAFGEEGQPEYLQPAKSTVKAPPQASPEKIAKFSNGDWELVDHPEHLKMLEEKAQEEQLKKTKKEMAKKAADKAAQLASAKAKLAALGLTEEELKALLG